MKPFIQRHITLWAILLLALPSWAASDNKVTATIDTNEILIGDWVQLTFEVRHSKDETVVWPIMEDKIELDSAIYLEIIKVSDIDTTDLAVQQRLSRTYTTTVFDSGYFVIPPFEFQFQDPDGNLDTKETEALLLTVNTVEVDTTAPIKPIKTPLDLPFKLIEMLDYIIIGGLVAMVIIGFILAFYFSRKRPKGIPRIISRPELPPHIVALQKLERLEEKKLWQNDEVKQYYSELSDIVREYIERRYEVLALESTTDEILQRMDRVGLEDKHRTNLAELLRLSDFVKFAKVKPLPDEHSRSIKQAYEFVRGTMIVESDKKEKGEQA